MTQKKTFLISNFNKNANFLRKCQITPHCFGPKSSGKANKNDFEFKMLKLIENPLKTQL